MFKPQARLSAGAGDLRGVCCGQLLYGAGRLKAGLLECISNSQSPAQGRGYTPRTAIQHCLHCRFCYISLDAAHGCMCMQPLPLEFLPDISSIGAQARVVRAGW